MHIRMTMCKDSCRTELVGKVVNCSERDERDQHQILIVDFFGEWTFNSRTGNNNKLGSLIIIV